MAIRNPEDAARLEDIFLVDRHAATTLQTSPQISQRAF
jgi:hypothetical protein